MENEMSMYDLLEKFQFSVMYEKMQNEKKYYSEHLKNGFADYLRDLYDKWGKGIYRGYSQERITRLLDESWMYDYTHVAELFKHAKCNKIYVGNGNGFVRELGNDKEIAFTDLAVSDDEQVVVIDKTDDSKYKFSMVEADKVIEVDMMLSPKEIVVPTVSIGKMDERRWARDEESLVLHVKMKQKTPEGAYLAFFDGHDYFGRGDVIFYPNECVRGIESSVLDRLQSEWLFGNESRYQDVLAHNFDGYPIRGSLKLHLDNGAYRVAKPAQLASKMYREGLPSVLSISNYKDISVQRYLEISDDEHELYSLSGEEEKFTRFVQNLAPLVNKDITLESDDIHSVVDEETIVQDYENFDVGETSVEERKIIPITDDMPEVIVKLIQIREYGIELSPEQEKIIRTYEKLHSKEFREFQANREERVRRQQEVREEIVRRNEEKEAWWSNPENPSNVREEEFSHMKKQMSALEGVQSIDASLLNDSQNEMLSNGKKFFELKEMFDSEEHVADTGMSNEAREWYQEHYTKR